jgi:hypothetical protein
MFYVLYCYMSKPLNQRAALSVISIWLWLWLLALAAPLALAAFARRTPPRRAPRAPLWRPLGPRAPRPCVAFACAACSCSRQQTEGASAFPLLSRRQDAAAAPAAERHTPAPARRAPPPAPAAARTRATLRGYARTRAPNTGHRPTAHRRHSLDSLYFRSQRRHQPQPQPQRAHPHARTRTRTRTAVDRRQTADMSTASESAEATATQSHTQHTTTASE